MCCSFLKRTSTSECPSAQKTNHSHYLSPRFPNPTAYWKSENPRLLFNHMILEFIYHENQSLTLKLAFFPVGFVYRCDKVYPKTFTAGFNF